MIYFPYPENTIFTSTLNIDIMGLYHTYPKNWTSPVDCLLIYPKLCWLNGIQCRPWSDAAFYDIQYKSLLFTLTGISIGILADHLWIWQRWQYAWNVKPFFLLKNKKTTKKHRNVYTHRSDQGLYIFLNVTFITSFKIVADNFQKYFLFQRK